MNAIEARAITNNNNADIKKAQLDDIMASIERAAKQGKDKISIFLISEDLYNDNKATLIELGFRIDSKKDTIEW